MMNSNQDLLIIVCQIDLPIKDLSDQPEHLLQNETIIFEDCHQKMNVHLVRFEKYFFHYYQDDYGFIFDNKIKINSDQNNM